MRGIGQGLGYLNNLRALNEIKLKIRLISKHEEPNFQAEFFGAKLNMPVMGASMSGLSLVSDITEEEFEYNILEGCKRAGTIGFAGNTSKEFGLPPELCSPILALKRVKGRGVNIFKPQSQEAIKKLIARAGKEKAIAVGIDIDGVGSSNSTLLGKPSYRKTADDIRELKKSTKLPLIIKGVMNAEDAALAVEAGADAIGVSNHGGRVLDSSQGVAEVLPDIAKAVKNAGKKNKKVFITADGGVRTGYDVVKMLALGANFVLIGRPLAREAVLNGAEGVKNFLNYIKQDIRTAMIMTSCNTLSDINERILIKTEY